MIRVLGEDKKERNVPLNQPVPKTDDKGRPMEDERGEAITRIYDLSLGKYDLAVEAGPSFTTQRDEAAATLQELIRANGDAAPILGAELVKMMDFPGAEKIAEKLSKIDPTNENRLPPEVQKQMQEGAQQIQKLTAENQQLKADRTGDQLDHQVEMSKLGLEGKKLELEARQGRPGRGAARHGADYAHESLGRGQGQPQHQPMARRDDAPACKGVLRHGKRRRERTCLGS